MNNVNTKIGFESFRLSMYGTYERTLANEQILPALYMLYANSDKVNFLQFKKQIAPLFLDPIVAD